MNHGTGRCEEAAGKGDWKGHAAPDAPLEETGNCTVNQ